MAKATLVTGASSAFGRALTESLAAEGMVWRTNCPSP